MAASVLPNDMKKTVVPSGWGLNFSPSTSGDNIAWVNVTNPLAESFIYDEAANIFSNMDQKKNECL